MVDIRLIHLVNIEAQFSYPGNILSESHSPTN
jgi:hypothetical protein